MRSRERKQSKTIDVIDDDDWMAIFDFDHSFFDRTKKISFFTFDWCFLHPTKEATLLSWRHQSPKKGLTYEKCFAHPLVDYKLKPNF